MLFLAKASCPFTSRRLLPYLRIRVQATARYLPLLDPASISTTPLEQWLVAAFLIGERFPALQPLPLFQLTHF
jgi:hypothetical protein